MGVGSNHSVVQMDVWILNLIESVGGERHLARKGEGRYEFGNNIEVEVEIGFEDLSVDLLHLVEVCTLVEI